MITFREKPPSRTCEKRYANYKSYKPFLMQDFNHRCGYCDDFDGWIGGSAVYHVDHFAPKSQFSTLENEYTNLVYACSFCNRFKSNNWPSEEHHISVVGDEGYIDPCNPIYDEHFYRDVFGNIKARNALARFMVKRLQLYLARHRVIWNLTRIKLEIEKLKPLLRKQKEGSQEYEKIKHVYFLLSIEFQDYLDYLLGANLSYEK